jgi:hypothetical protein
MIRSDGKTIGDFYPDGTYYYIEEYLYICKIEVIMDQEDSEIA